MYAERQVFPPTIVQQIREAVDPASLQRAKPATTASNSRNDPRKAMKRPGLAAPNPPGWGVPRPAPGRPAAPPPPAFNQLRPAMPGRPPHYFQQPGHVMYHQHPGAAPPMYGMPPGSMPSPMPLAPPPQAPLATSFRGVRLQVCMINSFQASRCLAGCPAPCLAVQHQKPEEIVIVNVCDTALMSGACRPSAQPVLAAHSCDVMYVHTVHGRQCNHMDGSHFAAGHGSECYRDCVRLSEREHRATRCASLRGLFVLASGVARAFMVTARMHCKQLC